MKTKAISVGTFEAKNKLSELLERVSQGAEVTITKHDRPIAKIVREEPATRAQCLKATAELRTQRSRYSLKGLTVRSLIDEGRK